MNTTKDFTIDDARNCLNLAIGICELAGPAVKAANGGGVDALDPQLFDAAACLLMKSRDFYDQDTDAIWQELRAFREQRDAAQATPVAKPKRGKAKGQ